MKVSLYRYSESNFNVEVEEELLYHKFSLSYVK